MEINVVRTNITELKNIYISIVIVDYQKFVRWEQKWTKTPEFLGSTTQLSIVFIIAWGNFILSSLYEEYYRLVCFTSKYVYCYRY